MITVKTPAEKRALAATLAEHDPGFLEDLKMFSEAFGAMQEVSYAADDVRAQERAENAYAEVLKTKTQESRDKALAALAAAKKATE